jgi:tetratricopeptide (TPR) repeat protein
LERERDRVRAAEGRKRRKVQRALAGAVALLVLGGGAFAWWLDRQTTERRFAELAREREAEDRLARNAAAVGGLVAECERHLRDENAGKAGLALAEIDRRTLDGGTDDFRDRIERCRTDLAVLRDLDRIDDLRWATKGGHFRGSQGAVEEWPAAFERFGVVVGETRPGDAAVRVKASLVRDRLLEALDLWLVSEPRRRFDLARVLELADPDWFRDSVRGALGAGNAEQVRRLAARDMATRQPPRFAAALGQVQEIPVERRGQILAEAARVRPGELGVLMAAGDIQPIDDPGTAAGRAQWYRAAVAVRPGCVGAWNHLGIALYDLRDYTGAVGAYGEAIGIDPKFAAAHNNLGYALQALGEYGGAVAAFDRALALEPEFALAYNNLAWLLATCPDARHRNAKRAVELAGRAVALRPGDWSYRDTLAAGYAEAGDFDSARKTQLQAIDLLNAEPNADGRDREGLRARLKLYLAKQPYREKAVGGPGLPVAPPPRQK